MQLLKKITLYLLGIALGWVSCTPAPISEDSWNPGFAFPLINTNLTIEDVLNQFDTEDLVNVDSTNFITIFYRNRDALTTDTVEFINVPNFNIPLVDSTMTVPAPLPADFEIDQMTTKAGKLYISFNSNVPQDVQVTLRLFDVTNNNQPLTKVINVSNPNGITPLAVEDSINLTGYKFDFSNGSFSWDYEARVVGTNQGVLMNNFWLRFRKLEYSYLEGYFGTRSFTIPTQELGVDIFKAWKSGRLTFTNPQLRLRFENSYGFPMRVSFDTLQAITRFDGIQDLYLAQLQNKADINYPALNEVGQIKATNVFANSTNSNIVDVVAKTPYGFRYQFTGTSNADANSTIRGFITDQSRLEITVVAELPLDGRAEQFTVVDTLPLSLQELPVGAASFKVLTNNAFPFSTHLQVYFLDFNGVTLDSMFLDPSQSLADAAPIDNNGRVTNPVQTVRFIDFTSDRVAFLKSNGSQVIVKAVFNTEGNSPVKIYSDYNIDVKVGVIIRPNG